MWEPDASGSLVHKTTYTYDALDNLRTVDQSGSRNRTFHYDSISQLTSATNPESGTTTYVYDHDGNLVSKTDARGVTTDYGYDELHRLRFKRYSDQTSPVSCWYDGADPSGGIPGGPATPGTGYVTISGEPRCFQDPILGEFCDQGTVSITVNSYMARADYGQFSTASGLANDLASRFNADPATPVTATVTNTTVYFTAKQAGAHTNYPLSAQVTAGFHPPSFSATPSGSTLTGGSDTGVIPGCSPTLATTNPIGRRTAMCDAAGWEAWSYDAAGRVLAAVDQANGINYALSASYAPHGALISVVHGQTGSFGGINLHQSFNNRLQPTSIRAWSTSGVALDLEYCFNSTVSDFTQACGVTPVVNNGNVARITNNRDTARSQRFTYDELNRIKTARTQATTGPHCWGQLFGHMNGSTFISGYDIWPIC